MQILFIAKNRNKSWSLNMGPVGLNIFFLLLLGLAVLVFMAGKDLALEQTRSSVETLYAEAAKQWHQEIQEQKILLEQAQESAEKNLDALATRLSQMHAHILRLDALGSRLVDMAEIKDINFDMGNTLGIGGPEENSLQSSMRVEDFITALNSLNAQITDRTEKLSAIESMLMDKTLQSQTTPADKPILKGWISSLFGKRTHPITGKVELHKGIDYAGNVGSPIIAVADGIVTWSGSRYGYGNMVEINHGNGYRTRYAHNKKNLVAVGRKVEKGQVIALMGSSGRSTGPHVHFEVIANGKAIDPRTLRSIN